MFYCTCGKMAGDCGCERVSGERIKAICEELDRLEQYDKAAKKFRKQLAKSRKHYFNAEIFEDMFNETFKHVGKALKKKIHR